MIHENYILSLPNTWYNILNNKILGNQFEWHCEKDYLKNALSHRLKQGHFSKILKSGNSAFLLFFCDITRWSPKKEHKEHKSV